MERARWNRSAGLGMAALKMSKLMRFLKSSHYPVILLLGAGFTLGSSLGALAQASGASAALPSDASSTAAAAPGSTKVVEDIVAQVNDQLITQSDFNRAAQQLEAEDAQQGLPAMEAEEHKKDLLRDLIDQQLLLSKGKDLGITGETELVKRLDEIRKQNHLDSMEALEKAAQAQGVSYEDFKANIRNGIITQKVVQNEVAPHLAITQTDIKNYYQAHQSDFYHPESVTLQEILIGTPADATDAQVTAAEAKANEIETKLKAGAKFTDLAKADSTGPTASEGGDLGQFARGKLGSKVLEDATFSLKPGQFTAPIRTKQGYLILKVTEHTQAGELSFQQAEPQVEQALYLQRMQPALRTYLTKLREGAAIFIKPGYVDTGASPDEIKISNTAYVAPGPKKKKKFARARFRGRRHNGKPAVEASASAAATAAEPAAASKPSKELSGTQKPGKREKIRFGQAPRESLPAASQDAGSSAVASNSTTGGATPSAPATSSSSSIGAETPVESEPEAKSHKTRFSDRAKIHKTKKQKAAAQAQAYEPPKASADELANEKVQDAPLGLAGPQQKMKKKKGPKKRLSDKKTEPQPVQQPYMKQTLPERTEPQAPPASSAQPPSPAANPPGSEAPGANP
jgi:peptidyl-prolyl cis-trans isomerase SurA